MIMAEKNTCIWVWLQDTEIYKAVYRQLDRTFIVLNSQDEVILTYRGLTLEQLQKLQALFARIGAKQIDNKKEPFTYL